jgi:hypothetical protein
MTRRPWGKTPVEMERYEPSLAELRSSVRATYDALFRIAHRQEPRVGFLLDERMQPLTIRDIARRTRREHSTILRHLPELHRRDLVVRDLAGERFVPLVIDIERRFARKGHGTIPNGTSPLGTSPTEGLRAGADAVENDPGGGAGGTTSGAAGTTDSLLGLEIERNTGGDFVAAVENIRPDFSEPLTIDPLVPAEVRDDRTRALLAKLACSSVTWRHVLFLPRDRRMLKNLAREHPRELLDVIEAAALSSRAPGNAGAWVTAEVRRRVQEAV